MNWLQLRSRFRFGVRARVSPCTMSSAYTAYSMFGCVSVCVCVCLCVFLLFQHCGFRFIRKNTDVTDRSLIFLLLNASQLSLVRFFKLCMRVTFPTIHTKSHTHTHTYTQSPDSHIIHTLDRNVQSAVQALFKHINLTACADYTV